MLGQRLLLTGATGFVAQAAYPSLVAAGWQVRCMTRRLAAARDRWPEREWVEGDAADEDACRRALDGCAAALYLIHGMGEGAGYQRREIEAARGFARAAAAAGVARIVYLGGVTAAGPASEHLGSRAAVGEVLRGGAVTAIELRASMIIGHGSLSWLIVRDLAARLPIMVLPRWLESRTEPIAVADVVAALVAALEIPAAGSACYALPGAEVMSGRQILEATARVMGRRRPRMLELPLLTPRLSSLWVRFVTRAKWSVAREIVVGLTHDLLAEDDRFWRLAGLGPRRSFAEAARQALAAEGAAPIGGLWGRIERALEPAGP